MQKKKRRKRSRVKFYVFKNLKCQGRKELRYVKECVRYGWPLPKKPKRIKTPLGYYTPDFGYKDKYIEIKCLGTFQVCLGLKAYKGIGELSDLQWRKICYVAKHKKPVHLIVYLSKRESAPDYKIEEENITIQFKGGYKKKT
jgi:hypothetical protein